MKTLTRSGFFVLCLSAAGLAYADYASIQKLDAAQGLHVGEKVEWKTPSMADMSVRVVTPCGLQIIKDHQKQTYEVTVWGGEGKTRVSRSYKSESNDTVVWGSDNDLRIWKDNSTERLRLKMKKGKPVAFFLIDQMGEEGHPFNRIECPDLENLTPN